MFDSLLMAVALVLVIEGLMPALSPGHFKQTMLNISKMDDRILRTLGLICMSAGALLVYFFKG